ncbi:MAG TPA: dihydrofolate reductase family protein [Pyrinomonadaceae bacterium]|jgi:dihydrofolate reductase|nr:dihydrofolate reductase family protein [Pyrinomonadaceae bacterium]
MRKVTFGGANSLDNFIARKDDSYDWLMWCKEAGEIMRDYWKTIDTMLMGRRTYEVAASHGPLPVHKGVKTYVFSRTLKQRGEKGLTIVSEDVVDFVRRLKEEDGKDICIMGGGLLARPLFEAGLIDEIGLNIQPLLLGSGIPLFHEMSRQIDLELTECRQLSNGSVFVTYRTKQAR